MSTKDLVIQADLLNAYKHVVALSLEMDSYSWDNLNEIKSIIAMQTMDEDIESFSERQSPLELETVEEAISYDKTYSGNTNLLFKLDRKDYDKVSQNSIPQIHCWI